jgi:tRNA threonylcarbamoyladenosine biosynthesis protein TsaB
LAIILNINTAFETAFVSLTNNDEIINEAQSNFQKDHASFLEPAIKSICNDAQIDLSALDAVCVISGPGSYTGLRVGLSSAKALCYALKKPLILLNTLDVMAFALSLQSPVQQPNLLFCPLIDARRMEVYTALYNNNLKLVKAYFSEIIDASFLESERKTNIIVAGGSGSLKLQRLIDDDSIIFINPLSFSKPASVLGYKAFVTRDFAEVAYSEPFYLKPVYFRK